MRRVTDLDQLQQIYSATPSEAAQIKVTPELTQPYRDWICRSRFCILSTVGPEGTDASPRGDDGPVVRIPDSETLLLPDWHGNNRIDSLRNILRDPRVSLMFFIQGATNVMRVNGRAFLTDDPAICASFEKQGKSPRSVTVIEIREVYPQCARAILRSGLWSGLDESQDLPSMGQMLEAIKADFGGAIYDAEWPGRATRSLW